MVSSDYSFSIDTSSSIRFTSKNGASSATVQEESPVTEDSGYNFGQIVDFASSTYEAFQGASQATREWGQAGAVQVEGYGEWTNLIMNQYVNQGAFKSIEQQSAINKQLDSILTNRTNVPTLGDMEDKIRAELEAQGVPSGDIEKLLNKAMTSLTEIGEDGLSNYDKMVSSLGSKVVDSLLDQTNGNITSEQASQQINDALKRFTSTTSQIASAFNASAEVAADDDKAEELFEAMDQAITQYIDPESLSEQEKHVAESTELNEIYTTERIDAPESVGYNGNSVTSVDPVTAGDVNVYNAGAEGA